MAHPLKIANISSLREGIGNDAVVQPRTSIFPEFDHCGVPTMIKNSVDTPCFKQKLDWCVNKRHVRGGTIPKERRIITSGPSHPNKQNLRR